MAAASARSRSLSRRPLASSAVPCLKSSPATRMCRPLPVPVATMTASPSLVAFSWITMVSAPGGSTPPVKMRAASPGPTAPATGCPAATSPTSLSRAGTSATSAARTAWPAMGETPAGGCVRNAARSAASTAPWASASGVGCAGSGSAAASTRDSASATGISATGSLLCFVVSGLAASLLHEADALDAHAALGRLHHVVDGEAGHRDRGQRFHLDAGLAGDLDGGAHLEAGQLTVGLELDGDLGYGEGMAQRDQLVRALARHDAGDAGGAQHVAFLGVTGQHEVERLRRHDHAAFRHCLALGRGLRRHVDHARLAALVEVTQLASVAHLTFLSVFAASPS